MKLISTIKVSDLHLAGLELLQDAESYLNELTDQELQGVAGGFIGLDALDLALEALETNINYKNVKTVYSETIRTVGVSYTVKTVAYKK